MLLLKLFQPEGEFAETNPKTARQCNRREIRVSAMPVLYYALLDLEFAGQVAACDERLFGASDFFQ